MNTHECTKIKTIIWSFSILLITIRNICFVKHLICPALGLQRHSPSNTNLPFPQPSPHQQEDYKVWPATPVPLTGLSFKALLPAAAIALSHNTPAFHPSDPYWTTFIISPHTLEPLLNLFKQLLKKLLKTKLFWGFDRGFKYLWTSFKNF